MEVEPTGPPAREVFKVITRGVEFSLSRPQVEFDSPNLFTSAFLDHDFPESRSRILETDRHPLLFAIILDHLSSYTILPLNSASIPPTMTPETALVNLASDALYFGLDRLHALVQLQLESPRLSSKIRALGYTGVVLVEDVRSRKVPLDLRVSSLQLRPQFENAEFFNSQVRCTRGNLPLAVLSQNVLLHIYILPVRMFASDEPERCHLTVAFPFLTLLGTPDRTTTALHEQRYVVDSSEGPWSNVSFLVDGNKGTLKDICAALRSDTPLPLSPLDSTLRTHIVDTEDENIPPQCWERGITVFADEIYATLTPVGLDPARETFADAGIGEFLHVVCRTMPTANAAIFRPPPPLA